MLCMRMLLIPLVPTLGAVPLRMDICFGWAVLLRVDSVKGQIRSRSWVQLPHTHPISMLGAEPEVNGALMRASLLLAAALQMARP